MVSKLDIVDKVFDMWAELKKKKKIDVSLFIEILILLNVKQR